MKQDDVIRQQALGGKRGGKTDRPLHTPSPGDPEPHELWVHLKSGSIYRVMLVALLEATLEPHVVYRIEGQGLDMWIRPLKEFRERFRPQ